MKSIELTKGEVALVDDADFDRASAFNWYCVTSKRYKYAARGIIVNGKRTLCYLHRWLMGAPSDVEVDHKDRNGLNCQRDNLRICNHGQNRSNSMSRNKTGFKGVCFNQNRTSFKKWMAVIKVSGKSKTLGYFATAQLAAARYDAAAIHYFGEFAGTNQKLGLLP